MLKLYLSLAYLTLIISFIVGSIMTLSIRDSRFYQKKLSNLNFLKSERLNKFIGVGVIKWIVKNTFFKYLNQKIKLKKKKIWICELYILRSEMNKSEIDHLFGFILVSLLMIIMIFQQEFLFGFILFVFNIFMNLYPALLQQQNKRRIDLLLKKAAKAKKLMNLLPRSGFSMR